MIITSEILNNKINGKIKIFKDTTCLVSLVNTEGNLGVVCYLMDSLDVWTPFSVTETKKCKIKAKTYRDLINNVPLLNRDNISNAKGKFYNTFDTPVEVNTEILTTIFEVLEQNKNITLERKTYYLITDVQELERTFNSNIMPCEIINFNNIDDLYKDRQIDESLRYVVKNILS